VPDESDLDEIVARARLRAKRAALAFVITVAVLFIASSAVQIIRAVFGLRSDPFAATLAEPTQRVCALGVSRLVRALDRASASQPRLSDEAVVDDATSAALRRRLSPDWDSADTVKRECERTFLGQDAWAALERLRRAQEELARRGQAELVSLRRDVSAHLPPDLR
jgi:hypothetical protein